MTLQNNLEIEVKFLVTDEEALRETLIAAGAEHVREKVYERNVRFDDEAGSLLKEGKLLRVRQDDAVRLTFKGEAELDRPSEAKVREELETTAGDFDTVVDILERLGFEPRQVYEKYRETFRLGDVEVVLDELPFGRFVELEGSEADIRDAARQLGLPWEERILDNYLLLMARVKVYYGLPFDDLTFENFAGRDVSIADVLRHEQPTEDLFVAPKHNST